MLHNRSVPVNTVLPHIFYEDVARALSWLKETFGFVEHYRFELPDGTSRPIIKTLELPMLILKKS